MFVFLIFHFRPLVPESVNNSLFHQLAEQLQQQNLEHLRQQLLEQQQPQKVRTPSCGCYLPEACRVSGISRIKCVK